MKYPYICRECDISTLIEKAMKDSSRVELCPCCKKPLIRQYTASAIKTTDGFKK